LSNKEIKKADDQTILSTEENNTDLK